MLNKIAYELNKSNNTNVVKVDGDKIIFPFKSDVFLELSKYREDEFYAVLYYAYEVNSFSSYDFDSIEEFINAIVDSINGIWNKKMKSILKDVKRFSFRIVTYLYNENGNWQEYSNCKIWRLPFSEKNTFVDEEIFDFSLKK